MISNLLIARFAPEISKYSLASCPSCMFDEARFNSLNLREATMDEFTPVLYRLHLAKDWVIECQNCGMLLSFPGESEAEVARDWNALPRAAQD